MTEKGISESIEKLDLGQINQVTGHYDARGLSFGIVVSRYNGELTAQLLENAVKALIR